MWFYKSCTNYTQVLYCTGIDFQSSLDMTSPGDVGMWCIVGVEASPGRRRHLVGTVST